ncbi:MAG TPA: cytochrome c-type biogenesis protein CcmH [Solirubrobacteraceae bacterium]|jgi:cytochrome c-type biogenesis protein CcmH
MTVRRAAVALIAALVLAPAAAPATALAVTPRASLTDIENDVMCVSCREPLAVAQSPQALAERNYIRHLIALGMTKPQIEQALVGQYGEAVLGKPPADGFNLTVYILPPAILVLGIGTLVFLLPKWRRRSRAAAAARPATSGPALDAADAHRLDEELTRYGG